MTDHVRILLIDDDHEDLLIVSDMLAEAENTRFRLDWVQSYEAGLEAISRQEHEVYLLDYFMGSHNGLDLLKDAVARGCKAPIIFLTAHGNLAVDLKAMEAGASDYLVKGEFTAPVLERSIRYSIMSKRIEEELKQHRSNLEDLVRKRTIQHAEARADAERRANEAERRQAILEALLEHIPEGIAVVDSPELQVQALSRYALEMVGLSGGDRRKPLTNLDLPLADLGPDRSGLLKPIRDAALRGKVSSNLEHTLKRHDKGEIALLLSAGPIRDGFGNVTGAVAAWRDISELKRIREELRIAHDNLELRVQKRTLELAETLIELKESREELKFLASQLLRAQEDERKRIAREMHDSIGSSLSAVKFCLENAAAQLRENPKFRESFMSLSRAVEQAIDESRRIITDLRPSILDDLGIIATLNWFCRRFGDIYTGIRVEKDVRLEEAHVPENLKIIIFRIIQESMNNSAKHSQARKICLSLSLEGGHIELRIDDDGVGFNQAAVIPKGQCGKFGLSSMRERAELSNGQFHIESAPGAGTVISVRWEIEQFSSAPDPAFPKSGAAQGSPSC
ncbi:MAG: histidine kinase [Syntrophobacteraceae bacterium]